MTLSGDGVEDDEVDKQFNWIIREFDQTTIALKNDDVESGINGCNSLHHNYIPYPIFKTTGSSEVPAPKRLRADNNEVIGSGDRADKTV